MSGQRSECYAAGARHVGLDKNDLLMEVENADSVSLEIGGHSWRIAHDWQRALDKNAVVATQNARNFFGVSVQVAET